MPGRAHPEIPVFTAQGEVEARLVASLLDKHDIPHRTQGEAVRLTHMFTVDGLGAVRFFVPEPWAEAARELLARLEEGGLSLQDDDFPGEGTPRDRWKELP